MTIANIKIVDIDHNWDNLIKKFPFDIYHLNAWLNAACCIDHGNAQAIIAEYNAKKIFFPIIKRSIDDKYWDATSTYGYGGPIVEYTLTPTEIDSILKQIKQYLSDIDCVSWFIRLHPILNKNWQSAIDEVVEHGPTLISDLSKSETELWQETQQRHCRAINKAKKLGMTTKIEKISYDNIPIFYNIYQETMHAVEADDYYFFDIEFFYKLCGQLDDRILIITAYIENQPIASSMYTLCEETGIIQFHLGGSLQSYKKFQPSKLITHDILCWGHQHGYNYLHLGGGVGAQKDSLYEYKKGFSSQELPFKTQRIITNPEIYNKLVNQSELSTQQKNSNFFPLYRAVRI